MIRNNPDEYVRRSDLWKRGVTDRPTEGRAEPETARHTFRTAPIDAAGYLDFRIRPSETKPS